MNGPTLKLHSYFAITSGLSLILSSLPYLMFSRASSLTVLSRSCRYLLRPQFSTRAFSLTARSHAAINAAMADTSGITADSLKNKLTETLQALHVEVEDLSGTKSDFEK